MRRLCVLLLVGLSGCVPPVYRSPYPVVPISLPRDDAGHPAPIEWWYYTGHFATAEGREYGFQLTFFKAYAPPEARLLGVVPAFIVAEKGHVAHAAITDIGGGRFEMAERADFWGYPARASYRELDVQVGGWYARRAADGVSHELFATVGNRRLRLILTPLKPAALHGEPPGIQSMGPGGVSYYLSYTRMALRGEYLECELWRCQRHEVHGQAWHDHQWGDFDISSYAGWDWFSLQFDDETELMLYLIREPSGRYQQQAGSFVTREGRVIPLTAADFALTASGASWQSPATGAIYPMGWQLQVPRLGIDVAVAPVLLAQEMDTRASTGIVYWEGAVRVSGSHSGKGYVELTNYDLYPFGQTDESTPLKPLRGPLGGG